MNGQSQGKLTSHSASSRFSFTHSKQASTPASGPRYPSCRSGIISCLRPANRVTSPLALISNSSTCDAARSTTCRMSDFPANGSIGLSAPFIRRARPPARITPMMLSFPEQAHDLAIRPDIYRLGRGNLRQAGHGHDLAADRHHEFRAGGEAHLAHIHHVID